MKKDLAEKFDREVGSIFASMIGSLALAEQIFSDEVYASYKKEVGLFIGRVDGKCLRPIYTQFPELMPEDLKGD